MQNLVVVHSMLSGKGSPEKRRKHIETLVETAARAAGTPDAAGIACVSSAEETGSVAERLIRGSVAKVVISGGDGFTSLFVNKLFQLKQSLRREDYDPEVLFLPGGTGNAVSFCANFKNPAAALKNFLMNRYRTERLEFLEVKAPDRAGLAHFVSFGADGEIISIYNSQKLRGFAGYLMAVLRYAFSRRLYNPFSRNDANYTVEITNNGDMLHTGRYEGGGVSAIPFIGYGFRPYPLAGDGRVHIRFVLYGALLMPTLFRFTRWTFLKRPNRIIYDRELTTPSVLDFSFSRALHIQVAGDLWEKLQRIRVEFSRAKSIKIVKRSGSS